MSGALVVAALAQADDASNGAQAMARLPKRKKRVRLFDGRSSAHVREPVVPRRLKRAREDNVTVLLSPSIATGVRGNSDKNALTVSTIQTDERAAKRSRVGSCVTALISASAALVSLADAATSLTNVDEKRLCHRLYGTSYTSYGWCVRIVNEYVLGPHEYAMHSLAFGATIASKAICYMLAARAVLGK